MAKIDIRGAIVPDPLPSIEEQILAENQYQTMLLELTTLGGM